MSIIFFMKCVKCEIILWSWQKSARKSWVLLDFCQCFFITSQCYAVIRASKIFISDRHSIWHFSSVMYYHSGNDNSSPITKINALTTTWYTVTPIQLICQRPESKLEFTLKSNDTFFVGKFIWISFRSSVV